MKPETSFEYRGLRWYAEAEELRGKLRSPVSLDLFLKTSDRGDHDPGDEDRKER